MRIFIAGCARSGTSLTRELMKCFKDIYVYDEREAPASKFDEIKTDEPNIVVKRTAGSYRRLANLPADIALLYCVRHPFDVLTSSHSKTRHIRPFHVTTQRWKREYKSLRNLAKKQPERNIFYSRYEDLVRRPDDAQERIGRFFSLETGIPFSENPKGPIRVSSLEKWRENPEFLDYVYGLPNAFVEKVSEFCDAFGYQMPPKP